MNPQFLAEGGIRGEWGFGGNKSVCRSGRFVLQTPPTEDHDCDAVVERMMAVALGAGNSAT